MELDASRQLKKLYGQQANFYIPIIDVITRDHNTKVGRNVLESLLNGKSHLNTRLIKQLEQFSKPADKDVSSRVRQAREVIRETFNDNSWPLFRNRGFRVILFGSLQYDDPLNCDADVLILAPGDDPELSNVARSSNAKDLVARWKSQRIGTEPHISTFALDDLRTIHAKRWLTPEQQFYEIFNASEALTGIPLFPEEAPLISGYRNSLEPIINNNPLFAAIANEKLRDCLSTRLQRRNLQRPSH
jgi:hypothetical protein